jgi:hypothetical protein
MNFAFRLGKSSIRFKHSSRDSFTRGGRLMMISSTGLGFFATVLSPGREEGFVQEF